MIRRAIALYSLIGLVVGGCHGNPPVHPTSGPCTPQSDHYCDDGLGCCTDETPICSVGAVPPYCEGWVDPSNLPPLEEQERDRSPRVPLASNWP